ncbi:19910_t:CDS:2, partial [Funneliformis geosporum]
TWCSQYVRESVRLGIEYAKKLANSKNRECLSNIRQPDFLKTPKHSSGLHLDIYYPQYGLAIEVQGKQHKHYIEHYHRTLEGF